MDRDRSIREVILKDGLLSQICASSRKFNAYKRFTKRGYQRKIHPCSTTNIKDPHGPIKNGFNELQEIFPEAGG
jgi:hypothetical protein